MVEPQAQLEAPTIVQTATLAVLTGSFVVLTMAVLAHQNFLRQLAQWGQSVKVSVYLKDEVPAAETSQIADFLKSHSLFSKVEFVSKDAAFASFSSRMAPHIPGLLTNLENDNPLPASFEASLSEGLGNGYKFDRLLEIVNEIKKFAAVDEVSYGQGWVENYASVLKVFSTTTSIFLTVLLCGSLFVIGNSIRSSINQRGEEIEVLELCGATRWMILWPFVFEGLVTGVSAAAASILICYGLYIWQADLLTTHFNFWNMKLSLEFLSWGRVFLMLLVGALLGGLGSYLWGRQLATGWAAADAAKVK